jgi:hypothetical protein
MIGSLSTYQPSLDATSPRYTANVDTSAGQNSPLYTFSYKFANPASTTGYTNVTVRIGNFVPASGYAVQLKVLKVNGVAVTIPPPNPPAAPLPGATSRQVATYQRNLTNYWRTYYNTPVKLSLRTGWNLVSGDFDGTGNIRSQLIYGDTTRPELNLTSPDRYQLRRLSTDSDNPWAPGAWDQTPHTMTGVWLGGSSTTPVTATVSGQFVAVMNPADLSFGFAMKGRIIDNSFGHKSFDVFVNSLSKYLNPSDPSGNLVPYVTPVTYVDATAGSSSPYDEILNYESFKGALQTPPGGAPPAPVVLTQHLQTMFFAVKDNAGNSKTFAVTIYLDPTAPRTGGNANPSGNVTPSSSMIALANVQYLIDLETFLMIEATRRPSPVESLAFEVKPNVTR